jgi:hypothetical protein
MATRITAFLKEINPQPTEVPRQLAVSLAPMFHPTYAPAPNIMRSTGSIVPPPPFHLRRYLKSRQHPKDIIANIKIDKDIIFIEMPRQ